MKYLTVLVFGLFISALATASECTIDLQYDIEVSSKALRVSDQTETIYEIRQGGWLSVKGEPVELDDEQRALAEEYAGEVAALVPQWMELVSTALTVAEKSLKVAFSAAFGEESEAVAKSGEALASARERFEASSSAEDGVYSISVFALNDLDGAFDEEFSEDIEDAIMASLGSIFIEIGKALISSDSDFDESMESFGNRMDLMGEELESMSDGLEETAEELCDGMRKVQKLERKLMKEVPELAGYQLFAT
ncbi:MAG: DUF2884 family protein [Proteobacteria bacterium]|nr:DUF2884 family protein [Pseudomonadota bacterium]